MKQTRKLTGFLKIALCVCMAFSIFGAVFTFVGSQNSTAKASATDITGISVTTEVLMTGYTHLEFSLVTGGASTTPKSEITSYWNDHPERATSNDNCDIMEYIYVNGVSTRELSNTNKVTNKYVGTGLADSAFPLTAGTMYAPVSVEIWSNGIINLKILNTFTNHQTCMVTFKTGLKYTNANGEILTLNKDVSFGYLERTFKEITTTDISTSFDIENWHNAESDGYTFLNVKHDIARSGRDWQTSSTDEIIWYNGVDPLEYIVITDGNGNSATARAFYSEDTNRVIVRTNPSYGAVVKLKQSWVGDGNFNITFKPGYRFYTGDNTAVCLYKEITFGFAEVGNITSWSSKYTLTFDGTDISRVVWKNFAIGEIPEVPAKNGYIAEGWAIDGVNIDANTAWSYSENKTATAVYTKDTNIDVTDTITITQDDWMSGSPTDCTTFSIRVNNVSGGYLYEYLVANSSIQGCWNDHAQYATTNGVDIMEYIHFNGESARSIVNNNTSYVGSTSPLSLGGKYAPIAVETQGSFTTLKVLNSWMPQDGFTITIKSGFRLLLSDGNVITTSSDVMFKYANGAIAKVQTYTLSFDGLDDTLTVVDNQPIGTLPLVPEKNGYTGVWQIDGETITAETVYNYGANKTAVAVYTQNGEEIDVTDTITLTRDDWMTEGGNATDCTTFSIRVKNDNGEGYRYEYLVADSSIQGYWNNNGATYTIANGGVDVMEYLYFNGESARSLVNKNKNGQTSFSGTTFPFNVAGEYAPIAIDTNGSFAKMMVLNSWMPQDGFIITIKSGFRLLLSDGNVITTSSDVMFKYANGAIAKVQTYTLSFDGLAETKTVISGEKIGELPEIADVDGEVVLGWAIDGTLIGENTVWTYNENKTATVKYADKYTLSFDGIDDTLTVIDNQPIGELPDVPAQDGLEGYWTIDGVEITENSVYTYGEAKTATAQYKKDITDTFALDHQPGFAGADTEVVFVAMVDPSSYLYTDSTVSGYWNLYGADLTSKNNNVDILEYICINGETVRNAVTKNTNNETNYKGDAGVLANGGAHAPVFVETTNASGLFIRIYTGYSNNYFEITFKAGFRLIDADGVIVYLTEDITFKYINDGTNTTVAKGEITDADLDNLEGKQVTLMDGENVEYDASKRVLTLPALENKVDQEGLSQVFVGWTTDTNTLADLYPAGYRLIPESAMTLYAVWLGFELQDGAGVRLTAGSPGIRFLTDIDSAGYNLGVEKGLILAVGTILCPTDYLNGVELNHNLQGSDANATYYTTVESSVDSEIVWKPNEYGYLTYAAAFTNISEKQYSREFSARGYLKIQFTTGVGYVYTNYNEEDNSRSIYQVATMAYEKYGSYQIVKDYVNKVLDLTWDADSFEMSETQYLYKNQNYEVKGNYSVESISQNGATFTVSVEGDFSSVLINGKRLSEGRSTNVQIGNFLYKFSDFTIVDNTVQFTLGAADKFAIKESDETLYFYSSDSDLDFFLNDFFKRHSGYTENGVDLKVNSVTAGVNSEEFFSHEWMSMAYYWYNSDDGYAEDRIAGLREFLSTVPVDDYGYVWSSNDKVRPNDATPGSAEQRMGWPYPSNDDIKGISWDFNGSTGSWSNNIGATSSNNLYTANVSGQTADIVFTSPTASSTGFKVNWYTYRKIYTYSAPLLEFDIRIDDVTNVNDILVGYTTSAQSTTQWVSVKDYAFMSYDIGNVSGAYNHLIFMPMYAFWGESTSTYIKQIQIKIDVKDGKSIDGNVGLNYVRPTIDTRYSNNNSILISSLRQDYDFTGDLEFLKENVTRARKAMNFLMQMYDTSRKLNKQSYLVGHDGDQGDIESSLGNGYWDILFMPEYDFQSNTYFYKALVDMAYLEQILVDNGITVNEDATIKTATRDTVTGTSSYGYTASGLETVASDVLTAMRKTTANNGFWDSTDGRFVAGCGADGNWYDYGYVAWNLEAIYYGVATETQATSIMNWLNSEDGLYDYEFAPKSITETGNKTALNGQYYNNSSIKNSWVNCQYGGAIMYTAFYDLMARINVQGADNAFGRLKAIEDWYMKVYNYYVENGTNPNEFYRYYYENLGVQMQGQGINGEILIDAEALESYLTISSVAYGFFGIDSIDGNTLVVAPELPTELNYWGMENLAFNFVEYDMVAYKNGVQITSVRGDATGLKIQVSLSYSQGQKVYVNGVEVNNYTVENGKVIITVDFGATVVEVR